MEIIESPLPPKPLTWALIFRKYLTWILEFELEGFKLQNLNLCLTESKITIKYVYYNLQCKKNYIKHLTKQITSIGTVLELPFTSPKNKYEAT
jgi:hypothetical protein